MVNLINRCWRLFGFGGGCYELVNRITDDKGDPIALVFKEI